MLGEYATASWKTVIVKRMEISWWNVSDHEVLVQPCEQEKI